MSQNRKVWIFIEQEAGEIAPVSLELLTKGRELAEKLDGRVCALLFGHEIADLAETVIHHGADVVLLADHPELAVYRTLPYAKVATALVRERQPYIFLLGATPVGRDLAPRIASGTRAGLTADCTDLQIGDFEMATVREGVMKLGQPDSTRQGEIERIEPQFDERDLVLQVLEREVQAPSCDLKGASVIVAGGVGVGSEESFQLIHELAEVLGAEVGASRAAVDAGFVSQEHQIGQTGVTVRPRLYIACGISGSVQHCAGMDQSSKIIAINTDPNAPIFSIAHYKIVGDLNEVIPLMISAYRENAK